MTSGFRSQDALRSKAQDWLFDHALPFWSRAGIDPSGVGAWEALAHDGAPLTTRNKRLRVMPRQAFVFASAGGDYAPLARALFDFALQHGVDPATGNLGALLSPDGAILDAPHDLYDLAFMGLAISALLGAGEDMQQALGWFDTALARLKAPRGWFETAARRLPRRQNPHMHLFEATTELFRVTGEGRYRVHAEECHALLRDVFLQPSGEIHEYFEEDWGAYQGDQAVEPGHMAEWIWLLDRFEKVTGAGHGVDTKKMWSRVLEGLDDTGLLRDSTLPLATTRRLWPQTELLKASLVIGGGDGGGEAAPDRVLERLFEDYLSTEIPGGWYDKRSIANGALLSTDMPSSTFYHLYVALTEYIRCADEAAS